MAIPSRQIGWGTEENLLWQISKQLEYLTKVIYNIGQTPPDPNCISFVVNTTADTFFTFTARSFTQDFTYTITWGDGQSDSGSSGEGTIQPEHTYADPNTTYTARICFSDASVINELDFPGFD
jgi:hypothetical protein